MIIIRGIGWIKPTEYGSILKKLQGNYNELKSLHSRLLQESVLRYPIKNFGRFDDSSKMTCCSIALALNDAGITYSNSTKNDIGVLGTNDNGCIKSNLSYFKDYVASGRIMARGNLFIYTLPSTPMAEAAIYFGFQGPLLYVKFQVNQIPSMLRFAGKMILREETSKMIAVEASEEKAVCFVLDKKNDASNMQTLFLEDILDITEKISDFDEMIEMLKRKVKM
ncbi:MAG: hypothetical protein KJ550_04710 [Proteobacteria bacterium]|nr:hypothetical protein [Desulfobacteraceae bacterium]MBU4012749.1 hypothetical protein [Pseudomonadota bacterium]MBU4127837.1 hypothetical protein [Pseudomonadota bacterium]MCG2757827.1 hypothetical protein [Desulfobacteraceae bacterium]